MQVEVYFGDDACTPAGVYSVRNEISALTWIFSLIPASSCKPQTLEAALREALEVRIGEVVGAEEKEARVDDSYRCEKESRLVEWGQRNGVKTKLQIARMLILILQCVFFSLSYQQWFKCVFWTEIDGYGRGAIATEDLKFGDVALEIPISSIISEEYVYNSDMVYHFISSSSIKDCVILMSDYFSSATNSGEDRWDDIWDNDALMDNEGEA